MISTGYFHFIRICSIFLQISQKWCQSKAKSLVFLPANYFCRLNNERVKPLQSLIAFFLIHPVFLNLKVLTLCNVYHNGVFRPK